MDQADKELVYKFVFSLILLFVLYQFGLLDNARFNVGPTYKNKQWY